MTCLRHVLSAWFVVVACIVAPCLHAEVPLADFARHTQFDDIKISPNGDYVAASAIVEGKTILSLVHLADMKGVNLRPRENRELAQFWWVAPDRVMYTVGDRDGPLEAPSSTGELYAVNADGSDAKIIFGYRMGQQGATRITHGTTRLAYADLVDPLRDDPRHALIATYAINGATVGHVRTMSASGVFPDVERIDLFTGATTRVTSSPLRNASFLTDHHGDVRFAFGTDVDQMRKVWYRSDADSPWTQALDEARDHERMAPLVFDRKGDKVYFSCGGANGVGGICLWNVATRKFTTLWSGTVSGVDDLVSSFDGDDIVAIRSMPDREAVTLLDKEAPAAKLLVGLMQQFPGEDVRVTSSTADGKKAIFLVYGDTNPGQFFLYDATSRKASLLFAREPWINPGQMAAVVPIELKARDGLALRGYLTRPPGKDDAKNLPLVVFVHGGPYGIRDRWEFDPTVQMLASRGYAVLQVNYRGSGGYGYGFMKAGFRQWGGAMQDDVTDATKWAIGQGVADPKRICIFGASYGGYAALEGAVKEPDLYRCAIGYVGVYDLRLMTTRGDVPQSVFGDNYLKMVLGEDQAVLWDRSPIAHIDRLKAKVMLIVGGQDTRVPPIHGESMHAALDKAHIAHEWLYRRTEGHGFYDEKNVEDLYTKLIAFLDHNIGSGTAAH